MIHKGRGLATIYYPSGFNGGGDPDLAYIRIKTDGTLDVSNATCEMGQGFKNVAVQIAAEVMQVDAATVNFDNTDSDTAMFSMDTAGTRSTVIAGNAILAAGKDLIEKIIQFAAKTFGVAAEELTYKDGMVFVAADPETCMNLAQIGASSTFGGVLLMGTGGYRPTTAGPREPETGFQHGSDVMGYGSEVVDVEVDDETGIVKVKNTYICYDMGTVINPTQAAAQALGGDVYGIGMALFEDLTPAFPRIIEPYQDDFTDYMLPTFSDAPEHTEVRFYENYDPTGPFGAKGCGEMVVDTQSPAIVNAIYDAVGVWVDSLPATPDKVLKLIREKQTAAK